MRKVLAMLMIGGGLIAGFGARAMPAQTTVSVPHGLVQRVDEDGHRGWGWRGRLEAQERWRRHERWERWQRMQAARRWHEQREHAWGYH